MKLHRIEITNLNSLYGDQAIDLDADLAGASLFLVQGPTGAGKSTIMDAISLGLFGLTPRLGALRSEAAVAEQVMSRGTGSARALVEFSKLEGGGRVRYRAGWKARRAREKPDGRMQATERSLERRGADGAWTVLVSDHRGKFFKPVFEEVLEGFTPQDFQRSMLLAQGRFDAMLHARPAERAAILERLTDTGEYKALGERAARMRGAWTGHLARLKARVEAISPVPPEALEAARVGAQEAQAEATRLDAHLQRVERWRGWRAQEAKLTERAAAAAAATKDADAASAAAAPDMAALATHERLAPAFLADDRAVAVQARQQAARARQEAAHALLAPAQVAVGDATRAGERAAAHRDAVQAATGALRPVVEAARAAEDKATRLQAEATRTAAIAQDRAEKAETAGTQAQAADTHRTERDAAAETAAAALAARQGDLPLREAFPALEKRQGLWTQAVADTQADAARLATSLKALQAQHAAVLSRRAQHEAQTGPALAETQRAADEAAAARAARLGSEGAADLRDRLRTTTEAADQKRARLREARTLQAARDQATGRRADARAALTGAAAQLQRTQGARTACQGERDGAEAARTTAEAALVPLQRILALGAARAELEPGEACPLCGSEAHPFHADPVARARSEAVETEAEAAAERRDAAASALEQATERLSAASVAVARAESEHKAAAEAEASAGAAAETAEAALAAGLVAAGLEPTTSAPALATAEADAQTAASDARQAETQAQALITRADDTARALATQREAAREATAAFDQEQAGLAGRIKSQAEELERTGARFQACDTEKDQLVAAWTSLGVARGVPSEALAAARVRVQALDAAQKAHDTAAADARTARVAAEAAEAARTLADTEKAQAADQRDADRRAATAAAEEARTTRVTLAEHWHAASAHDAEGSAPRPDPSGALATLLADQEKRTRISAASAERAQRTLADANQALAAARSAAAELDKALASVGVEHAAAEADRIAALQAGDIADRETLRAARIPAARLASLIETRRRLQAQRTTAQATAREVATQQREHAQARPTDLPESADPDALTALAEQTRATLATTRERLTQAQVVLGKAASAEADLALARAALETGNRDAAVWLRLHSLIGQSDGDAFKLFAQALNLDQLLRSANRHLARLSERYRLRPERGEDGLPTLEFVVDDAWRPGAARSLKTLSGGESFLVSLALALGLSDLRTSSMPVETLLLDEGFGTLDPKTLDIALAALQQLRASGRQVGIISHVGELQERIQARIHVEPQGEGRSRVRVDLGG